MAATPRPDLVLSHAVVTSDVTGNFDHLLKLRVPDMRRHNELMEALVWRLAGVREVRTYAVIDEVKNTTRIPL